MFSILLSTVDWKHQKVKAKFLEIVLFKNSLTWFLGAWHGFLLPEVNNTAFICFQWNRGQVGVCLGNACSSELHYALMRHRFSSTMLLDGAFCSLAWETARTNPIIHQLPLMLNKSDATGCSGFWGRKALTRGDASRQLTWLMKHNRASREFVNCLSWQCNLYQVPGGREPRKVASGYGVLCNKDSERLKTGLSATQGGFYSHEGRQRSY